MSIVLVRNRRYGIGDIFFKSALRKIQTPGLIQKFICCNPNDQRKHFFGSRPAQQQFAIALQFCSSKRFSVHLRMSVYDMVDLNKFFNRHIQDGLTLAHLFALTSYALTSSNIDRFSNLFHCLNQENICNNTITKDPITPQECRYTTS